MSLSIIMFIFFVRCWNDHQQLARKNVIVNDANIAGNEDNMYCSYIDFKLNQHFSSFNDVVGIQWLRPLMTDASSWILHHWMMTHAIECECLNIFSRLIYQFETLKSKPEKQCLLVINNKRRRNNPLHRIIIRTSHAQGYSAQLHLLYVAAYEHKQICISPTE